MNFAIQPLSPIRLGPVAHLAKSVFPDQKWWEDSSWGLSLSVLPNWIALPWFALAGVRRCRYWVAANPAGNVLGLTGIYSCRLEPRDRCWLGWTCVAPEWRGRGIGQELLDFAIERARLNNLRSMRVYTTSQFGRAVEMYQRRGFRRVPSRVHHDRQVGPPVADERLVFELDLR